MQQAAFARTPAHLWIVGVLSLVWNCFGAYDYLMTRLHNMQYLSSMGDPNAILSYVEGLPMYGQFGWGLGVWSGLLGSVLLLIRSRYAVHAFLASLIGMVLSFGAQWLGPPPPPEMASSAMKYVPILIIALGLAQLWYAARQAKVRVLR